MGDASTNDYEEIKALEQLTDLEVQVRRLNDRIVDIRKEQAYFKVCSFYSLLYFPTY